MDQQGKQGQSLNDKERGEKHALLSQRDLGRLANPDQARGHPVNAVFPAFLLLQNRHVLIEELL